MSLKIILSLIAVWFSGFFLLAQSTLTIIDEYDQLPISSANILYEGRVLGQTNTDGIFVVPKDIMNVQIDKEGYPIQIVKLDNQPKTIVLNYNIMELAAITFTPDGNKVKELIKEVVKKQKQNSPKSLSSYHLENYSKITIDRDYKAIPFIENPKSRKDSAQNKSIEHSKKSLDFISERAMHFDFKKGSGEKQSVIAERIAGLKSPLYEFAAVQPISFEFNKDNFNFFFKSFPNPISRVGLTKFDYKINDTITVEGRKQIEVIFKRKKNEKPYLQGTFYIDLIDKALTKFYAERKKRKNSGETVQFSNDFETYIETEFIKKEGKWIPNHQAFRILTQSSRYRTTKDSILTDGSIVQDTIPKKVDMWVNMDNKFSNFDSPYEFEKGHFDGYGQEVLQNAFKKFNEIIPEYRTEPLSLREENTYTVIDSIVSKTDVNLLMNAYRLYSSGGFLNLGKVDLDLKEILAFNDYERIRLGLQLRTSKAFHKRLQLKGGLHYGIEDKAFKYNIGSEYLLSLKNSLKVFAHFTDDIKAAGRFSSPLMQPFTYYFWRNTLSNNELYTDHVFWETGLQRDFWRKLTGRITFKQGKSRALFPYAYKNGFDNTTYNQAKINLDFRFAPKEEHIQTPIGKLTPTMEVEGPIFLLSISKDIKAFDGAFDFTRVYAGLWHKELIGSFPFEFTLRGGKVFGDAPLWENFQGIGTANGGVLLDRLRIGGVEAFETMQPGEFYVDTMLFGMTKVRLAKLNVGKKKWDVALSYKAGWGTMDNPIDHNLIYFKTMEDVYQEVGLEFNKAFLKFFGLGFYYRLGAYATDSFEEDFTLKFTLNL